ncbi:BMP family ABC transporter substrate-binding protein [Tumidithrix helvetica PCC 7403]|uniref:BMP family protein n=1 Tax=Tumidithrix helvetica TaxID=3457545 RepID=UPI003CC354E0
MQSRVSQITIAFVALIAVLLTNCMASDETADNRDAAMGNRFRAAIVLPAAIVDRSWSQSGYEGLKFIEKRYKASVTHVDRVAEKDALSVTRNLAQQGYDFIILHGGEYIATAETAAQEFPRTKFALTSGHPGNNRNLGSVVFRTGESGYLAGFVAGLKTQTNRIAYLTGFPYPSNKEEADFLEKGAKAANPKSQVVVEYLYTWTDIEKASKAALNQIAAGADIIMINLDHNEEVIKAVTRKPDVYAIGWTKDQYYAAPSKVVTSAITDISTLVSNAADLAQRGRWEGKLYKFGIREKALRFAPFRGLLTPEQEGRFNKVRSDVMTGKLELL